MRPDNGTGARTHPVQGRRTVPPGSRLVGHIRGDCCCIVPVDTRRPAGTILTDSLPEGILHLLLVDSTGRPRSERLVFLKRTGKRERWTVTPDKPRYGKREKVRVGIKLEDCDGKPVSADLSVSVTDRRAVRYDSLGDDIRTNLLLCSDIKGYVHNPGYYFRDDDPVREHRLDLVMMTNGWRRFKTRNLYEPEPFTPRHFIERGQYLSGKVIGIAGKPAPEASVSAVALNRENIATRRWPTTPVGSCYPAWTSPIPCCSWWRPKPAGGSPRSESTWTGCTRGRPLTERPPFPDSAESVRKAVGDYLKQQKMQYAMIDGAKVYELEGVEVTAADQRRPKSSAYGAVYDTAKLAPYKPMLLYNYVAYYIPNVHFWEYLYLKKIASIEYAPAQLCFNGRIINV